jgi:hypothetical protein
MSKVCQRMDGECDRLEAKVRELEQALTSSLVKSEARIRELEQEQESIVQRSRDYALLEEKVAQLEQEREESELDLQCASTIFMEISEAIGRPVPEEQTTVNLRELVNHVIGIIEEGKVQLAAITEDRDLWKEAHDDDCPNKNMLESTEAQLQAVTQERERLQQKLCDAREATVIVRMDRYADLDTVPAIQSLYGLWQDALHRNPLIAQLQSRNSELLMKIEILEDKLLAAKRP